MKLKNYLYESLLDDEDDLINNGDEDIYNDYKERILNYLYNDRDFNRNISFSNSYIMDKLDKSGEYIICPCTNKEPYSIDYSFNSPEFIIIQDPPKGRYIKTEKGYKGLAGTNKVFGGSMWVSGDVKQCPKEIKIGPISTTNIYGSIPDNLIPMYSVTFSVSNTDYIAGKTINCRLFMCKKLGSNKTPITVNIKGDTTKNNTLSVSDPDLKRWSQLKIFNSNTKNIYLYNTDLSNNIINKYQSQDGKSVFIDYDDPEFKSILNNFKNLKEVTLDVGCSLFKNSSGWELYFANI